jgi:predicted RNase H-like HicB family nuclease
MAVHEEVLRAAQRICQQRGGWTFRAEEVVRALPHLNENSVRTHVSSRCCVNAPVNHDHRWPYFKRLERGRYEIAKAFRVASRARDAADRVGEPEPVAPYHGAGGRFPAIQDTIHAVLHRSGGGYVAECLEVAVVTQGRTADEVLRNLREAVALHLEGEDADALGVAERPRLSVTYEMPVGPDAGEA